MALTLSAKGSSTGEPPKRITTTCLPVPQSQSMRASWSRGSFISARSQPSDSYISVRPAKTRTVSLSSRETLSMPRARKASAGVVTLVGWIMELPAP